jgi:hypothetical protein
MKDAWRRRCGSFDGFVGWTSVVKERRFVVIDEA